MPQTSARRSRNAASGRWLMPQVRLPCTLLCPRTGHGPGAFAADVAAQEQQVDDLAHRIDAVLVLREAEAPGDDHALRRQVRVSQLADVGLGNAGALDEVGPGRGLDDRAVLVEARACSAR